MTPKNGEKRGTRDYFPLLVAVVGSLLGGGGGTYLYLRQGMSPEIMQQLSRHDPFTGAQGRALEFRIKRLEFGTDSLPPAAVRTEIRGLRRDLEKIEHRLDIVERDFHRSD